MIFFDLDWSLLLKKDYSLFPDNILEYIGISYGIKQIKISDPFQRERYINILRKEIRPSIKNIGEWNSNIDIMKKFYQVKTKKQVFISHRIVEKFLGGSTNYDGNNSIFIYWKCILLNIDEIKTNDYEELLKFNDYSIDELRIRAIAMVSNFNKKQLLEICVEPIIPQKVSQESMKNIYDVFHDIKSLQGGINPLKQINAIALAAIRYHIDIRSSRNPVLEYQKLKFKFEPIDPLFKKGYSINPHYYNLKVMFHEYFPIDYYSIDVLQNISLMYGQVFLSEDKEDLYDFCVKNKSISHFYVGIYPTTTDETTLLTAEPIIPNNLIFWYGTDEKHCHVTCEELFNWFTSQDQMLSFIEKDILHADVVFRLKTMLHYEVISNLNNPLTGEERYSREKLKNLIDSIVLRSTQIPHITQKEHKYFIILMRAAMFMRGWDGKSAFPLTTADCYGKEVDDLKLSATLDKLRYLPKSIADFPLYVYRHGNYIKDTSNYPTFGTRVLLILSQKTDVEEACIRTTSNYFAITAYRVLGEGLDPDKLDYIS